MDGWDRALKILPAVFAVLAAIGLATGVWDIFFVGFIPTLQWAGYLFVRSRGKARRAHLKNLFLAAQAASIKSPSLTVRSLGGVKWVIESGTFQRLSRQGRDGLAHYLVAKVGSDYGSRFANEMRNQHTRLWEAVVLPLLIPLSGLLYYVDNTERTQDWVASQQIFLIVGLFAPLLVTAWELAYRMGYQRVWGAVVFEAEQEPAERKAVEDQKAHGDAGTTGQGEALAAASGNMRRSKVHDQRF